MTSSIVIFHPGSRHLYFGRSTDPVPLSILHIIARKRTSNSPDHIRKDRIVPISGRKLLEKVPHEVESARLQLSLTLQSALKSVEEVKSEGTAGGGVGQQRKIILTDIPSLASYNKNAKKTPILAKPAALPILPEQLKNKQFVVGNDALGVSEDESFNIFCPWRRGQLNLNREVGGSITAVIKDLEDIWRWCITEKLRIPLKDINNYRAVVVVPVMFDRVHAKEVMNLLINQLGFQSAFLVQDHVCASFGCGIPCATVVDIGDQKISVSCVEDGVSYPQSRLELKYGGGDLTVALWNQFNLTSFPLPIDISQQWDLEFLNGIKEKYCNLDLKSWKSGPREEKLLWDKPGQVPIEYCVRFGDELLIVPLSHFNPDLLRGSIGRKAVICYGPQPSVTDDPFDKLFLAETALMKKSNGKDNNNEYCEEEDGGDDHSRTGSTSQQHQKKLAFEIPLGIDQAIVRSIESCKVSDDLKRRWYSCVILIGGGVKIIGLLEWLRTRMGCVLKAKRFKLNQDDDHDEANICATTTTNEQTTPRVNSSAKSGGDSSTTVWKGAAILSSLETAKELWISEREWRTFGSKVLREKSLFHY